MPTKTNTEYPQLSNVQIAKCFTLDRFGVKQAEIAREIGCNQSTVSRTLGHYDYDMFIERDTQHSRPHKTTPFEDRNLAIIAK